MNAKRTAYRITVCLLILLVSIFLVQCGTPETDTQEAIITPTPAAEASGNQSAAGDEELGELNAEALITEPTSELTGTADLQESNNFPKFELASPVATSTSQPAPTEAPETPALPTATETPEMTATSTAAPATNTPTPAPVIVTLESVDAVDRTCPNPSPERPEFYHYYLSAQSWPSPNLEIGEHFWLSKPFAGGGRLLITDWFPYGYDAGGRYLIHNGIDMAEPMGAPLLAAADGTVVVAGSDFDRLYGWRCDWYGQLVVILLEEKWQDQPVYILYGHVQNIAVVVGQQVAAGQKIAEVGVGGAASLPHLHFEVRVGENTFRGTRNPLLWISPPDSRGVVAGRLVDPDGRPWQGVPVTLIAQSEDGEDYTSWSYLGDPDPLLNPDERHAENFVIGDVKPGLYEALVSLQGITYASVIEVMPLQVTTLEIITEHYMTPTPPAEGGG